MNGSLHGGSRLGGQSFGDIQILGFGVHLNTSGKELGWILVLCSEPNTTAVLVIFLLLQSHDMCN